jgi:hypothetical protein
MIDYGVLNMSSEGVPSILYISESWSMSDLPQNIGFCKYNSAIIVPNKFINDYKRNLRNLNFININK